jgi:hypothetical protein
MVPHACHSSTWMAVTKRKRNTKILLTYEFELKVFLINLINVYLHISI